MNDIQAHVRNEMLKLIRTVGPDMHTPETEKHIKDATQAWRYAFGPDTWPGLVKAKDDDFWKHWHVIRSTSMFIPTMEREVSRIWLDEQGDSDA